MSTALRPRLWQAVGIAAVSFGSQALADVSLPVIHRLAFDAAGVEAASQLPERVAIVPMNGAATAVLVGLLSATPATPPAAYPAGMALMLLSGGPLLDQPDQAAAHSLLREGFEFSLVLDYTSVRAAGHQLERNLPWRPLVQAALPDLLPAGEYSVTVTWRAVDKLELPAPLPGREKRSDDQVPGAGVLTHRRLPAPLACWSASGPDCCSNAATARLDLLELNLALDGLR